jgi:hypothetical protein
MLFHPTILSGTLTNHEHAVPASSGNFKRPFFWGKVKIAAQKSPTDFNQSGRTVTTGG